MYEFVFLFIVALLGHLAHTYQHVRESRGQKPPMGEAAFHLAIMGGWAAFFAMIPFDPYETILPEPVPLLGGFLFIAGLLIGVAAGLEKKGFKEEKKLVKTGVYSKIRHPFYTGLVLMCVGYPVFFQKPLSLLLALVFFIPPIVYWKKMEEEELGNRFAEYAEYRKKTWF